MKSYGWTEDYVKYGITGARGWVFFNWAIENESRVWGGNVVHTTPGYVKQHYQKIRCCWSQPNDSGKEVIWTK